MDRRRFVTAGAATTAMALSSAIGHGQTPAPVLDDMSVLRQALDLHPGLYRYLSPSAVNSGIQQLEREWGANPALPARYLALSRFLATIRCGHSYANFFNQKRAVATPLFAGQTRLPFHFAWIDDATVVTNGSASGIARGSVITRIGDETPLNLRTRLMPLIRADGHNVAKRISLLEVRGDDTIETFDVFQGLVAPPRDAAFRISLRDPGGRRRSLTIPAIDLAGRRAQMADGANVKDGPVWQWRITDGDIAVLTMPGWANWGSKWDWQGWLSERLDSLGSARGLIVDLRNNEGGADCGDMILARLIAKDFTPPRVEQRLRFRATPKVLDPYLDTWDASFRTLGVGATALPDGFFRRPDAEDTLTIAVSPKRITCPVRVLTSPVNSSATFQFASNFRSIGAGKLVGRPTGGNRRGINGGCFFFVRLPESGIEFDLPLVGYFPTVPQPDAGLLPDVFVAET